MRQRSNEMAELML